MIGDLYKRPIDTHGEISVYMVKKTMQPGQADKDLFKGTELQCDEFIKNYNAKILRERLERNN